VENTKPLDTPYGDRRAMCGTRGGNIWQLQHMVAHSLVSVHPETLSFWNRANNRDFV